MRARLRGYGHEKLGDRAAVPPPTLQRWPAVVSGSLTFTLVMVRARLSVADIFHRGVVLSLIGVCVWGIGTGVLVHRDTLRMGRG